MKIKFYVYSFTVLFATVLGALGVAAVATTASSPAATKTATATSYFASFFVGEGNSLWDDLYRKCGHKATFYCVQTELSNYINDTLDSELRITDGIYFVKQRPSSGETKSSSVPISYNDTDSVSSSSTTAKKRIGRAVDTAAAMPVVAGDKEINTGAANSTTDETLSKDDDEDEEKFSSFVQTVERIEDDLEAVPSQPVNSTMQFENETITYDDDDVDEGRKMSDENAGFVVRSLNKVTDMLYDKTSRYLSTHDLRLDLPQTFFGGSRMIVSPRGFDEDGGILLKLNVLPAEITPRMGHIGKYFHKMFKKKLLTSFLALLLIIKLIKIKLMYVLPVIIGVNAAKKLLLKTLLFLFPPLVHLFKLCTYYHAHAAKLHFHHHKIKHHHHHIKVPVPVPVPIHSHKPHTHYGSPHGPHDEYDAVGPPVVVGEHDSAGHHSYDSHPSYGSPEYYTRNDMTNAHGDELASWGLKDFYASTESPGVLSAQAQEFSPFAEQNYNKLLQTAASKNYATVYKKNKGSSNAWKTKSSHGVKTVANYDSFYSPILQRIDTIFSQLGFNDEGCRERLICSMYKNPIRFSPHSNLLSTELSRDPAELERPSQSNAVSIRFYKYVEAARDGQSQKDCLILYPDCVVRTE